MIRNYRILNKIGSGTYGIVYRVENTQNHQILALKDMYLHNLSEKEQNQLVLEVCIQKCNTNPYIIKYYDSFIDNDHVYIISEYASNGDLQSLINYHKKNNIIFNNQFISKTILQIILGLVYLHKYHIVHRDLKPSNIFFDNNWNVKIGDLGIAKFFPDNKLIHSCIGSPLYMSPETYSGDGYNELTDIWSLGCILYNMLTFELPYKADNILRLAYIINNEPFKPLNDRKEWQTILNDLLNKNVKNRPTALKLTDSTFLITQSGIQLNDITNITNSSNRIEENITKIYNDISGNLNYQLDIINKFNLKNTIKLPPLLINKRNSDSACIKEPKSYRRYSDPNHNKLLLPLLTHR
jgi:NIMA (never in mitosis gene a)-related kinase